MMTSYNRLHYSRHLGAFLAVFLLGACETAPNQPTAPAAMARTDLTTTIFRCDNQSVILQTGMGGRTGIELTVGAETFTLEPVVSASGARYRAVGEPGTGFWNKGTVATLELRGETWPECVRQVDNLLRAQGNEPGWTLEIGDEQIILVTDYGETRHVMARPKPATNPDAHDDRTVYHVTQNADHPDITITLGDRICTDDMTGMPHPKTVRVDMGNRTLRGCGGNPATLLSGGEWIVTDLDGVEPNPMGSITLAFEPNDDMQNHHVAGSASCNRYSATYDLSGEGLTVSQAIATRMACAPDLMAQESRFLDTLTEVTRFSFNEDGQLVLRTDDNRSITARRD